MNDLVQRSVEAAIESLQGIDFGDCSIRFIKRAGKLVRTEVTTMQSFEAAATHDHPESKISKGPPGK